MKFRVKFRKVFIVLLILTLSPNLVYASELNSYKSEKIEDVTLKFVPHDKVSTLTTVPIYPKSVEMPGHTLKQAGFQVKNLIYKAPAKYKKVLKFYKKRLGKTAKLNEVYEGRDQAKAHFFIQAGSQSRNVILEPFSDYETQITIIIFQGGGGAVVDGQNK